MFPLHVSLLELSFTKDHRLSSFDKRDRLPTSLEARSSKIKVSAGLVPLEAVKERSVQAFLLDFQMTVFSLSFFTSFSYYACLSVGDMAFFMIRLVVMPHCAQSLSRV